MSFASDVKKELTGLEVHREHAKAESTVCLECTNGKCCNCSSNVFIAERSLPCTSRIISS